ncbi:cytochrome P450 [Martensiomyces pterosporus]|nr:cytochrome P450 [Martensiomyces pterosporus]
MFIEVLLESYKLTYWHVLGTATALYASAAVVYGLLLSPLRNIPGRFITKLSVAYFKYLLFTGHAADSYEEDYYKYGDIYTLAPDVVVLCNPSDCKQVLNSYGFPKSDSYKAFEIFGESIFTTSSARVNRIRRRLIGPTFTHSNLAKMEPTISECGILSIKKKWDEAIQSSATGTSATVDYGRHLYLASFEVISTLSCGQRSYLLEKGETDLLRWHEGYIMFGLARFATSFASRFPLGLLVKPLSQAAQKLGVFIGAAAERRRELLRTDRIEKPNDILQAQIDAVDPLTKTKLSESEIIAENIDIMLAGTDTTSLTMTWTLHYMMLYPDVYKRAVHEVRGAFPHGHLIEYAEGKEKLPYLEACIYEALRTRGATAVALLRDVPKGGATFQGHFIPEGTQVGVNLTAMNNHKDLWDNPRRFIPERFINNEAARQNMVTFSVGVRVCPGRSLAWVEMIIVLANLLKDYDMELPKDSLFGPDNLDAHGNPITMPRKQTLIVAPSQPILETGTSTGSVRGQSTTVTRRQVHQTPSEAEPHATNNADPECSSAPAESKGEIMSDAYSTIAEEYDRLIRIATFGNPWRKTIFVNKMAPLPGERLLDVAGGTCDIAQRYLAYQDTVNHDSTSTVHVVDFNPAMLAVGKRHLADTQWIRDGRVTFAQGDAENLVDIPDNSYDVYSISMGMHNLANREKALAEAYRVLKPGGRFACLEAGYIESPILRTAVGWYWSYIVPMMGRVLTSNYSSFMDMMQSARDFPRQHEFVETIRSAGFHLPGKGYEAIHGGVLVAYFGVKPEDPPQSQ